MINETVIGGRLVVTISDMGVQGGSLLAVPSAPSWHSLQPAQSTLQKEPKSILLYSFSIQQIKKRISNHLVCVSRIEFDEFYGGSFIPFLLEEATIVPRIFRGNELSTIARLVQDGRRNVSVKRVVALKESVFRESGAEYAVTIGMQIGSLIDWNR